MNLITIFIRRQHSTIGSVLVAFQGLFSKR